MSKDSPEESQRRESPQLGRDCCLVGREILVDLSNRIWVMPQKLRSLACRKVVSSAGALVLVKAAMTELQYHLLHSIGAEE